MAFTSDGRPFGCILPTPAASLSPAVACSSWGESRAWGHGIIRLNEGEFGKLRCDARAGRWRRSMPSSQ